MQSLSRSRALQGPLDLAAIVEFRRNLPAQVLEPSSLGAYTSAVRNIATFCHRLNRGFPPDADTLSLFFAFTAMAGYSPTYISSLRSAYRRFAEIYGFENVSSLPEVVTVFNFARTLRSKGYQPRRAYPLSAAVAEQIFNLALHATDTISAELLRDVALFAIAYYSALRPHTLAVLRRCFFLFDEHDNFSIFVPQDIEKRSKKDRIVKLCNISTPSLALTVMDEVVLPYLSYLGYEPSSDAFIAKPVRRGVVSLLPLDRVSPSVFTKIWRALCTRVGFTDEPSPAFAGISGYSSRRGAATEAFSSSPPDTAGASTSALLGHKAGSNTYKTYVGAGPVRRPRKRES